MGLVMYTPSIAMSAGLLCSYELLSLISCVNIIKSIDVFIEFSGCI